MNRFILLVICLASVMCHNGYAADTAVSPRSVAIKAAINNHPTVIAAKASLYAAFLREKAAFDIMMAALARDLNNTTNRNELKEASANWCQLTTATEEARKQCKEVYLATRLSLARTTP